MMSYYAEEDKQQQSWCANIYMDVRPWSFVSSCCPVAGAAVIDLIMELGISSIQLKETTDRHIHKRLLPPVSCPLVHSCERENIQ
jgi:hypothetical protein